MTRDITPDLQHIKLYLTQPHKCSYLPDKKATTAFVDPALTVGQDLYMHLTNLGFRRSGKYFYSPRCQACSACISTRIPVNEFAPSRRQKRCIKSNLDLSWSLKTHIARDEHYPLYERYITARHADGDMFPPTQAQFMDFLGEAYSNTQYLELRLNNQLIACTVSDVLENGLSAIYTYYDPREDKRSLGTLAVLTLIQLADELELAYVYLGFWIKNCQKMSYKTQYSPLEYLIDGQWTRNPGNFS